MTIAPAYLVVFLAEVLLPLVREQCQEAWIAIEPGGGADMLCTKLLFRHVAEFQQAITYMARIIEQRIRRLVVGDMEAQAFTFDFLQC